MPSKLSYKNVYVIEFKTSNNNIIVNRTSNGFAFAQESFHVKIIGKATTTFNNSLE